jgi:hypothetical protein
MRQPSAIARFLACFRKPQPNMEFWTKESQGGNHYVNDRFDGGQTNMIAVANNGPAVLTRAEFNAPPN